MAQYQSDRNLLFGVIAIQMDFITRDALIAAMNAWVLEKDKPLGHILVERGDLGENEFALLDPLVDKHVERHGGDAEQSLESLTSVSWMRQDLRAIADPDLDASVAHLGAAAGTTDPMETLPPSVGSSSSAGQRFRILRLHDSGGLGEVYVARDEELNREVALKQIKESYADNHEGRSRFLLEAEVTGGLEHPGIVPVYGLGHYPDGRPFYTMRFIRGDNLKDAIEQFHRADREPGRDPGERVLALRQLLRRYVDVCNAVAYAHSRGVLHRDLKPGNVMLGPYGETLVVDWGLAKPIGRPEGVPASIEGTLRPSSGGGSTLTRMGSAVGTPAYMSPEQAAGRLDELGSASDVYSLGAVLYSLLTGRAPFTDGNLDAMLRKVKAGEFPPPRQVSRTVPAALEAVCLKAMAKEPSNRYISPKTLADDVEHWLADEPVTARQEPLVQRALRWARKHRTAMTGAAGALVAGVIGLAVVSVVTVRANDRLTKANVAITNANKATTEALEGSKESLKQAEAVSTFLVEALRSPDPELDGRAVKVVDVLDRAAEQLDSDFDGSQATKGALFNALGETYRGLGLYEQAMSALSKACEVRRAALGPDDPETLTSRSSLAVVYKDVGRVMDAVRLNQEVLKLREMRLGPYHLATLTSRSNLARAYHAAGRFAQAIALDEATLTLRESKLGADHRDTLTSRNNLALDYLAIGRGAEAIELMKSAVEMSESKLGRDHPTTLGNLNSLARAYYEAGRYAGATELDEETLKVRESKLGLAHPDTLTSRNNLALDYLANSRLADAVKLQQDAVKELGAKLGGSHPMTLASRANLALIYKVAGLWDEAIQMYKKLAKEFESGLGSDHPDTLTIYHNLALCYATSDRLSEAIALNERTLKLRESRQGSDHPDTLRCRANLALAYYRDGRAKEAVSLYEELLTRMKSKLGSDHPDYLMSLGGLAEAYRVDGRISDATRVNEELLAAMESKFGPDHLSTLVCRNNLALAFSRSGRTADAIPLFKQNLNRWERRLGLSHPYTILGFSNLASAYEALNQWPDAELLRRELLARRRKSQKPDIPGVTGALAELALNLLKQSKWSDAEPVLRECLAIREKMASDEWLRFNTMSMLGWALLGQNKFAEAEPSIIGGYEGMKARESKIPPTGKPRLLEAAERVVRLYQAWGKPAKVTEWKVKLGLADLPAEAFALP